MKLSDLKPDPENPRTITADALAALSVSLEEFGDLSGIVWNKRTGELICGHQRLKALQEEHGERLKMDGETIIAPGGERFSVRVVDWSKKRQRLANIVANSPGVAGDFTPGALDALDLIAEDFPELSADLLLNDLKDDLNTQFKDDLINIDTENNQNVPQDILDNVWREWAEEITNQYDILSRHGTSVSGITQAYAKIHFLNALYKYHEYPRHCSIAFHPQQFITPGSKTSLYDGLKKVASKEINAERLRFITNNNPSISKIIASGLAFSDARLPLDFPASLARNLINEYASGGTVLDPCHGWGGRLVGFLLSEGSRYYGVDVSQLQSDGVNKIKNAFLPLVANGKSVKLICDPFEEHKLEETFDFAITSPPYYDVEKYKGGKQSHFYTNYQQWRSMFYEPLIRKVFINLNDGGTFALQVGSQTYPIKTDGISIAKDIGFIIEKEYGAGIENNFTKTPEDTRETIIIMRKQHR